MLGTFFAGHFLYCRQKSPNLIGRDGKAESERYRCEYEPRDLLGPSESNRRDPRRPFAQAHHVERVEDGGRPDERVSCKRATDELCGGARGNEYCNTRECHRARRKGARLGELAAESALDERHHHSRQLDDEGAP